ncbi:MAG: alpha-L-fucosidase [Bacteroidales bacterium]
MKKDGSQFLTLLVGSLIIFPAFCQAVAAENRWIEAEDARLVDGASGIADGEASGGYMVSLAKPGEAIRFKKQFPAGKLVIRYTSVETGTISVLVDDLPAVKVNVHPSGALTGTFLNAIADVTVAAGTSLTIKHQDDDVSINVDCIIIGTGDPGLPPDIWNLPPLKPADRPYPADWHYQAGQKYMDAHRIIRLLPENVSRNGSMLLNITQHGRGDLDPEVVRICRGVGAWLKINGEAIYSSRPFEISEEEDKTAYYTRNNGFLFAILPDWDGSPVVLKALHSGGATLGKVTKVEMLGPDTPLTFVQSDQGLSVTTRYSIKLFEGITDQSLAGACRVSRITHDQNWYNDDDQGATYPGWIRSCNRGAGDYNNDLTLCKTPGEVWSSTFTGTGVIIVAPKESGAGILEVRIDGQFRATADLSTDCPRMAQQIVCEVSGLNSGKHSVSLINHGPGPVPIDALVAL